VIGIDLAERLLALAREKARQRALQNIAFRAADMLEVDYQPESFDVVLCVFGIFFVPDMPAAVRQSTGVCFPRSGPKARGINPQILATSSDQVFGCVP
jgi:ubiquinone/menaquinone biosynthesis C-methylase UbiE